jgi:hypothetical protein
MVALTLLDGTTIQVPAKPRRPREGSVRPTPTASAWRSKMTARDLVKALTMVAEGGDPREIFGEKAPVEAVCAAILSLLLRKGLIADWEFVEELRGKK